MNAMAAVKRYGDSLIGKTVVTQPYGQWPGGLATVIEIAPDPGAPEIVFQVRSSDPAVKALGMSEIGVFDHEEIKVLADKTNA